MARALTAPSARRRQAAAFTLIELLVAIAILALLALMGWRGIDGMARSQNQLRERADALLVIQGALGQWGADLDAIEAPSPTRAFDWDGRVLRLTRRSGAGEGSGLRVVAWALRDTNGGVQWARWASPAVATRGDWQQAWAQAATWGSDGTLGAGSATVLLPAAQWQLMFYRDEAWRPLANAEVLGTTGAAPDGLRLWITLPPGPALAGTLVRDWVRPNFVQARS